MHSRGSATNGNGNHNGNRTSLDRGEGAAHGRPMGVERGGRGGRSDDGEAFLHDPQSGRAHTKDVLAEQLAEEFLSAATSANETTEDTRDEVFTEELGGPFLEGRASMEFADGVDESNPSTAPREPFPAAMRSERSRR